MGEQNRPKSNHLMIFMRALLTDGVRVCQVRAYYTELATTCHCMALTTIHDSEIHWTSTRDIANEIHDPIMIFKSYLLRVQIHKGVDQCSGLRFNQWRSQDIAVARAQHGHTTFVRTSTRSAEAYRGSCLGASPPPPPPSLKI